MSGDLHKIALHATQATERLQVEPSGGGGLRARRDTTRLAATATLFLLPSVGLHGIASMECHSTGGPEGKDTCGVLEPTGRLGARVRAPALALVLRQRWVATCDLPPSVNCTAPLPSCVATRTSTSSKASASTLGYVLRVGATRLMRWLATRRSSSSAAGWTT